ncbi:hypothetical protein Q7526_00505 [Glaesserella parasuis]|nr:hypothetical protein [Glaesserella parasuis]MDO9960224.1 hypothetical protein [Glaesserella parasuis]MDP0341017.1 hypothetical protein [Glaesserella parasuis]MDP0356386.1 hypothetical protein [Glaesserella parasuis]
MITEQEKQEILNGAYGITRNGFKCKYIGTNTLQRYVFAFFNDKDEILHVIDMLGKFNRFKHAEEGEFDVVGLWKDKPEPFDLERALAGEPVMLRNGSKAIILKQVGDTLIGYFDECSPLAWKLNGYVSSYVDPDHEIVGMWKEPKPVSKNVTYTLPRALRKPKDEMWYVNECGVYESAYHKDISSDVFEQRPYFASKADAKAWFNAMQDSRR